MRPRGTRSALVALVVALSASACTASDGGETASPTAAGSPLTVNVMSFNIEYGGEGVDFDSVAKAIKAADADVVGIEEGYGNVPKIAAALGWDYYDVRTQVVSKYPLLTPADDSSQAVLVQPDPGRVFALLNVHLPSSAYGPNKALAGASSEELMRIEEKQRVPELQPFLDEATGYLDQGIPVLMTGDFNSPSHLDWTEATVGLRDQIKFPMDWPTSELAANAGLVDTYRSLFPDPVADQGLTWPADRPFVKGYNPADGGKPADRIDMIYTGGDVTATAMAIVGEKGSEFTDIPVSPWPSDHRAVVGTFEIGLGAAPTLVSADQRLGEIGQPRQVYYNASGGDAATLTVVHRGGEVADAVMTHAVADSSNGHWSMATKDLAAGVYDIVLTGTDGKELAWTRVWLVRPGSSPTVTTDQSTYDVNVPIRVSWNNSAGNRWDWLGVYKRGANPSDGAYLNYVYTHATVQGQATIDAYADGGPWPLPPGDYTVYLMQDDSYVALGGANFSVVQQ